MYVIIDRATHPGRRHFAAEEAADETPAAVTAFLAPSCD